MPKTKLDKQNQAKERQEKYNKLSLEGKLNQLDRKFGVSVGAKKQRARLKKLLKKGSNEKKTDK